MRYNYLPVVFLFQPSLLPLSSSPRKVFTLSSSSTSSSFVRRRFLFQQTTALKVRNISIKSSASYSINLVGTYNSFPSCYRAAFIMDSSTTSTKTTTKTDAVLSTEELRMKRLIAFGIQNPMNIITNIPVSTTKVNSNHNENSNYKIASHHRNSSQNNNTTTTEVIDLLDDDDIEPNDDVVITVDDSDDDDDINDTSTMKRRRSNAETSTSIRLSTPPPKKTSHNPYTSYHTSILPHRPSKYLNTNEEENECDRILWDDDNDDDNDRKQSASNRKVVKEQQDQNPSSLLHNSTATTTTTNLKRNDKIQRDSQQSSFQVATWNVWFGPWGDGNPHSTIRMKSIIHHLFESNNNDDHTDGRVHSSSSSTNGNNPSVKPPLWCIGFQEVVSETAKPLKQLLQEKYKYKWLEQPSKIVAYKCAMAVHPALQILDHGWIPYDQTVMSRGFLYVRAKVPNDTTGSKEILFTTTHLESYTGPNYNGAPQRLQQIQQMCTYIQQEQFMKYPSLEHAIITGDMNWDDERASTRRTCIDTELLSAIPKGWKDTWLEATVESQQDEVTNAEELDNFDTDKKRKKSTKTIKKKQGTVMEGYTYDSKLNPMLGGSLRRRFDRILISRRARVNQTNDSNQGLQIIGIPQLLGTQVISSDLTWEKYNTYTQTTREVPLAPSDHFGYVVTFGI